MTAKGGCLSCDSCCPRAGHKSPYRISPGSPPIIRQGPLSPTLGPTHHFDPQKLSLCDSTLKSPHDSQSYSSFNHVASASSESLSTPEILTHVSLPPFNESSETLLTTSRSTIKTRNQYPVSQAIGGKPPTLSSLPLTFSPWLPHPSSYSCQGAITSLRSRDFLLCYSTQLPSNQIQSKEAPVSVITPRSIVPGQASHQIAQHHQYHRIHFRISAFN